MGDNSYNTYTKLEAKSWPIPNYWDIIAVILVIALLLTLAWGSAAMLGSYHLGDKIQISLNPWMLPYYALRTVVRMLLAMILSLIVTFTLGSLAAKNQTAERLIIPMVDVLQSVPILGFLSITISGFVALFYGSLLGPECAAIFAIFTSQVWNMILSFYQSLRTVPNDLKEASRNFGLSKWQHFWKIDVPFAMPSLLWNMMMSMSSSWVFLVAAETIAVAGHTITLPGIGSYLAQATMLANTPAIIYVIAMMVAVIFIYDMVLFRPLIVWAEKFKMHATHEENEPESWVNNLFQRTRLLNYFIKVMSLLGNQISNLSWPNTTILHKKRAYKQTSQAKLQRKLKKTTQLKKYIIYSAILLLILAGFNKPLYFFLKDIHLNDVMITLSLGLLTALRVFSMIILSMIFWVPIGTWIGLRPKITRIAQPIVQLLAAFPINLIFPVVVLIMLKYHLNFDIWSAPLIVLGTQWYILFNVIAGVKALPQQLCDAVDSFNMRGWLWWRKFILPGILPYLITGAITATGGAWNVSIIAEVVNWGPTQLTASGLGSYIVMMTAQGNMPKLILSIIVMSGYVLLLNRIVWKPLYNLAEKNM